MNNRQIVASLNEIANLLDNNGLYKEASDITKVMVKVSQLRGYYSNMSELEQMNQIPNWIANAMVTSRNTNEQFNLDGSKTQNAGWRYIRSLQGKIYPEVYEKLNEEFAKQVASNQAYDQRQKKTKFPETSYIGPDEIIDPFLEQALAVHAEGGDGWTKLNELIRTNPVLNQNEERTINLKRKFYYAVQNPNRLPK